jgi:hypothetical protein
MDGVKEAIDLAGALGDAVDYLIGYLVAKYQDRLEQYDETITVDPQIERAREAVERAIHAGSEPSPATRGRATGSEMDERPRGGA